jgi:DsbC/DsbD-like thiol-disulfide interchange protein
MNSSIICMAPPVKFRVNFSFYILWDNSQAEITKQAFNEASGLIKALQTLKNRPHSKFDYAVTGDAERFDVITNISVENTDALTNNHWTSNLALIFDRATKETVANLGWRPRSKRAPWGFKQELKSDKNGDIINIVKYLTQAAVAQNLVV